MDNSECLAYLVQLFQLNKRFKFPLLLLKRELFVFSIVSS